MRKLLVGLAMLLFVAALAAQDNQATPRNPGDKLAEPPVRGDAGRSGGRTATVAEGPRLEQEMQARVMQMRNAENAVEALNRHRNDLAAEHKVRLATLEAEHKTKIATLDRDLLKASAQLEETKRDLQRMHEDMHRQQLRGPRVGPEGGVDTGERIDEPSAVPSAGGPRHANPDQKLDAILKKLEQMDARLRQLEGDRARPRR